jgi:hypothetical protein
MVRKKRWFLLGLVGSLVGVAVKLLRGRKEDDLKTWEPPPSTPEE